MRPPIRPGKRPANPVNFRMYENNNIRPTEQQHTTNRVVGGQNGLTGCAYARTHSGVIGVTLKNIKTSRFAYVNGHISLNHFTRQE